MAERSVSSIEPPSNKLRHQENNFGRFLWSWNRRGSFKIKEIQDVPISMSQSGQIERIKMPDVLNSLNCFSLLQSLEIQFVTISLRLLILLSSLSSLKFLRIGEFTWSPELGDLRSLPSLYEDWVNKKRSNDSVSPDREEDNHVSSVPDADGGGIEEPERRAGETPGVPDADGGGIEEPERRAGETPGVPDADGGGIEEPERRAGETPGLSTVISHGTDGLESIVQSVMLPLLWQVVDELANSGDWERMFEKFNLENVLRNTPSYSDRLNQITNNLRSDFPRLLQLRDRNPSLSSEDLKVHCVPLCWSSKERVDFWSDLSDELFSRATVPNPPAELKELTLELEKTWQLHFGGDWVDGLGQRDFGEEWFHKIDEGWIINHGRNWINKIDGEWIKIIGAEYSPWGSYCIFVRGLLRFIRNRPRHPDKFLESHGLRSAESFYNYLDALFPDLLMVSYGVAYRFCKDEPWFKKYKGNLCRSTSGRHAP